jgi:hypothetical protein
MERTSTAVLIIPPTPSLPPTTSEAMYQPTLQTTRVSIGTALDSCLPSSSSHSPLPSSPSSPDYWHFVPGLEAPSPPSSPWYPDFP